MSGSVLEIVRSAHEDIELLEEAASRTLCRRVQTNLNVAAEHSVEFLRSEILKKASELKEFYDDKESMRTDAVALLSGDSGSDVWQAFYSRLRVIKEYFRSHSETQTVPSVPSCEYWTELSDDVCMRKLEQFTGEEAHGRYLDMAHLHHEYLNLRKIQDFHKKEFVQSQWAKHLRRHGDISDTLFEEFRDQKGKDYRPVDYVTWLHNFDAFDRIPRYLKYKQHDYMVYLGHVREYLVNFTRLQRPLLDVDDEVAKFSSQFDTDWRSGNLDGWVTKTSELPTYALVTDRLFATEVAMKGHLGSKEYTKSYTKYESASEEQKAAMIETSRQIDYSIALLEGAIRYFKELLSDTLERTVDHVTRRQARTAKEVTKELSQLAGEDANLHENPDDALSDESSSGGEDVDPNDRAIYNPKNLPMGPDGKPIPYWQFKLFGLDKEFTCEICGMYTYFGRRAFEKHFSEWRHINGLKALRIPNSNHFFGITGIEEAINLNDQLRKQASAAIFNADKDMECEDAMGNVMSYRAYQDLVRQGML